MRQAFSEQLRKAVRDNSISRYRLAQLTGIAESTLCLFVRGERGLSLDSIDRLMDTLKLEIKSRKQRRK
jgi:hypothetical protein